MKNLLVKYYFLILLILQQLLIQQINAQEEYIFRQIRIEDGLSQSTVHCMLQDRKGYLWFGTANGLNRYDGYSFKIFSNDPLDTTSLSDNGIISLCEDKDGYIWVGTIEGVLNRYDRKSGTFKRFYINENLNIESGTKERYFDFPLPFSRNSNKTITAIAEGDDNSLWVGTWGNGLLKFDKKKFATEYFSSTSGKSDRINSYRIKTIIIDKSSVWVGTIGAGLYKISINPDGYRFTNFTNDESNPNSLSNNQVISLYRDRLGDIWIGTYGGGLNYLSKENQEFSSGKAKFIRYKNRKNDSSSISGNIITAIIEDNRSKIWIGTFGGGLNQFDLSSKTFRNFKNDPDIQSSISKNDLLTLLEDQSGIIWIGSHLGKGLNRLERTTAKFKQINKNPDSRKGLNDDVIWAITEDSNSNLLVGTYRGGLNIWNKKENKFTYMKLDSSFNHIRALTRDDSKNIWIGTYSGGLYLYNELTKRTKNYRNVPDDSLSLGSDQVQSIFIDSGKNIWIGTFGGGLNKVHYANNYSEISFQRFTNNPQNPFSLSDDRVYSIYEDSFGILWIGTFGGGLNKYDKKTDHFISYKNITGDETSLSDNRVMTIYEDKKGTLWVGTYGGGLLKFNRRTEKFTRYNKTNRLNSSVVYGILEDDFDNLWMSTDNGLFKFNIESGYFTQYDLHDGLQSLEFSGGAYYKSKSGEMFFGGINGLNYFFPRLVKDNYYVPKVVFSSVRIFNDVIRGELDTINISYDENLLSIEFASLDFTNPPDNQYAYFLEGFDTDWHYVDSRRRIANYTNLSPGQYIFYVRGSNNDGVWNNVGKKLFINISPPYWQTWWFISLFVLIIAFILYYLSTIRFRNLLAIEKLKSQLSADLHDNIGSGLTEISILSELASKDILTVSEESSQKLKSISDKARTLIDNMSDIVWMVNPQRDSLYHVILRLKDTYNELFQSMHISFGTSNIEKFSSIKLPMEYKQNLFLIFKEAINNSVKHSKCNKIFLDANLKKDTLELVLSDDGIGMDLNNIRYGNGILNMKSRARIINGTFDIKSTNEGTVITFTGKITWLNKLSPFKIKNL